jgi:hypothetical protein
MLAATAAALSSPFAWAQSAPTQSAGLLVPAYFHPAVRADDWSRLAAAAAQVPTIVVLNPSNGPGRRVDPYYPPVLQQLKSAGATVVGYVYTQWGRRSLSAVKSSVQTFYALYPTIDGIFVDEMAAQASTRLLAYYRELAAFVRAQRDGARLVGNPGCAFDRAFYDQRCADLFVDQEGPLADFAGQPRAAWSGQAPTAAFGEIAFGAPSSSEGARQLRRRGAGWVYCTNLAGDNPYEALPSDFESMLASLLQPL